MTAMHGRWTRTEAGICVRNRFMRTCRVAARLGEPRLLISSSSPAFMDSRSWEVAAEARRRGRWCSGGEAEQCAVDFALHLTASVNLSAVACISDEIWVRERGLARCDARGLKEAESERTDNLRRVRVADGYSLRVCVREMR
jgi:hypothetical protein